MNIITVIPLTNSKVAEELSYFTSGDIPIGAVVGVPLRSRSIHAIVTAVKPAENEKSSIKKAAFTIRKLGRVRAAMFFPTQFVEVARTLANYYATTVGSVIHSLISSDILENAHRIAPPLPRQDTLTMPAKVTDSSSVKEGVYAVQGDDHDRMGSWRSIIRQEFARKRSIAFFAPTVEEARGIFSFLEKGIEGYIFLMHNGMTSKRIEEVWEKISNTDHPVTIITTSQFALLPRTDIDLVVIERENSRDWIGRKAPYIDSRHALELLARKRGQTVYLSDSILRVETLYRLSAHEINEGSPFKWRSISTARDEVIDMRRSRDGQAEKDTFRVISPKLEMLINDNIAQNTHLFIYNTRRGYAPSTICGDCQSVVTCKQCSTPVVLHTSKESGRNFFMCHRCGERRSADETCIYCNSWKLITLGIGIDKVKEEIRARFPTIDIFQIDSDNAKTMKQIYDVLEKFKERPGSILLGTEMSLAYMRDKVDHVAIASVDSLFSLPDFRIQEKIMHTFTRLRAMATRTIFLQTRLPTEKVFEYAMKGNLSDFYRSTIEDRAAFKYPPFSVLIKITIEGAKDAIALSMATVQDMMNPYQIDVFPAFTATVRGNSIIHGLIRVDSHSWPDPDLVAKLRSLPPSVVVRVGPETLL